MNKRIVLFLILATLVSLVFSVPAAYSFQSPIETPSKEDPTPELTPECVGSTAGGECSPTPVLQVDETPPSKEVPPNTEYEEGPPLSRGGPARNISHKAHKKSQGGLTCNGPGRYRLCHR